MEDSELLKLAAKAAGIALLDRPEVHAFSAGLAAAHGNWSPLTDDGDALRLAVKLQMRLDVFRHSSSASITTYTDRIWAEEGHSIGQMSDPATRRAIVRAATRRAIVRAAAAMATARDA